LHGLLKVVPGLADAASEQMGLVAEPAGGAPEFGVEVTEVREAAVPPLDPLEEVPNTLVRIAVWGIAGQLLQPQSGGGAGGQEVLDRLPAMDRGPVPDHEQFAGDCQLNETWT
jgi:hypothetical protein